MKLSHARGATQDGWVIVERSDRMWMWSAGEGNGKPLQYSGLENPINRMKRQMIGYWKKFPRSVGTQHATGDQWRYNSRKNEGMEPKEKQYPVVDVTGDTSRIRCCKEQYCIGTWNVRSIRWMWSPSVMSDSSQPHGLQATRRLCSWDFPGKSTEVGCHCLLLLAHSSRYNGHLS